MSETAAALGLAINFTHGGKTYPVAPVDYEIEGLFSLWLEDRAYAVIERHAARLGPLGVAMQSDSWRRECAAGKYEWDEPDCWFARQTAVGRKYLAALRLAKGSSGGLGMAAAQALVSEVYADDAARDRLEAALARASADPTPPAPSPEERPAGGSAS